MATPAGGGGFHPIAAGLESSDCIPLAFADFNNNRHTDVVCVNSEFTTLSVHIWNPAKRVYDEAPQTRVSFDAALAYTIENVVPADANHDGCTDLIVSARSAKSKEDTLTKVFYGNCADSLNDHAPKALLPHRYGVQPVLVDLYGNLNPGLLAYFDSSAGGNNKNDVGLSFLDLDTGVLTLVEEMGVFDYSKGAPCKLSAPHSVAKVDVDGDCLSDLVLTCSSTAGGEPTEVQVWRNQPVEGTYILARTYNYPQKAGPLAFVDVDGDGTIDVATYSCVTSYLGSTTCTLKLIFNTQMGLCKYGLPWNCRKNHELCVADPNFEFGFDEDKIMSIPFDELVPGGKVNVQLDKTPLGDGFKLPLAFGDYNNDGYADLVLSTSTGVAILESIPCTTELCGESHRDRRYFKDSINNSTKTKRDLEERGVFNSVALTHSVFLDIDNDGLLDVVTIQKTDKRFMVSSYLNTMRGAYSISGLATNEECSGACDLSSDAKPAYHGVSYKYTLIEDSGHRRQREVMQLSQSNYLSLQAPLAHIGLGRQNNYLDDLFVGSSFRMRHTKDIAKREKKDYLKSHFTWYQAVFANSQIISLVNYAGHDLKLDDENKSKRNEGVSTFLFSSNKFSDYGIYIAQSWKNIIYIRPTDAYLGAISIITAIMLALAVTVISLQLIEIREDKIEKIKALHRINFGAL